VNRIVWLLRWRGAELALWIGLAFIAAALGFTWASVKPLEKRLDTLERARHAQPQSEVQRVEDEMARQNSPKQQLASFYDYFAAGGSITESLAKLYDAAKANGLEMPRAEYRMLSAPTARLARYQVVVPLQGDYSTIRTFMMNALRDLPTMSLDHVQFQRKAVGESAVDCQLTFSFHIAK
jgi:HAMP domain-containing protein